MVVLGAGARIVASKAAGGESVAERAEERVDPSRHESVGRLPGRCRDMIDPIGIDHRPQRERKHLRTLKRHAALYDISPGRQYGVTVASEPTVPLAEAAYRRLRGEIIACRLQPGQRITERALAGAFGFGVAPIRDALTRLDHDGLADRHHRPFGKAEEKAADEQKREPRGEPAGG